MASLPLVQTAHRCLRHVFFDKTESNPVSSLFAEQALLALLASIYTSQALEKIPGDARAPADNWQVLASYIDAHITDPELSVQAVADVLRVTTRWVHRLFKTRSLQYTGYVRERRLQLARGGAGGSTARSRRNQGNRRVLRFPACEPFHPPLS